MYKKDLHIVYGFSSKATLVESNFINPEQGYILEFDDFPSIGPICDLDNIDAIEARKEWIENIYGTIELEDKSNWIENNLNRIKTLLQTANDYKCIYLWLGDNSDEKITAARLLYHLQDLPLPIYKLNFSKMDFRNDQGVKLDLSTLQTMRIENVTEAALHFEEMSIQDKQIFYSIWETLLTDKNMIHLFDKSNKYFSEDETFFDQYLLNRCSKQTQKSSLIVGYTLCDIWAEFEGVGDIFLFHRLNILANKGLIEITDRHEDQERGQMIFNVRRLV